MKPSLAGIQGAMQIKAQKRRGFKLLTLVNALPGGEENKS